MYSISKISNISMTYINDISRDNPADSKEYLIVDTLFSDIRTQLHCVKFVFIWVNFARCYARKKKVKVKVRGFIHQSTLNAFRYGSRKDHTVLPANYTIPVFTS